jgi:hypothetical protein
MMTIFIDNIILFLNVLEQFAIRVTVFGIDVEDIIKYVNKLYFGDNNDYVNNLVKKVKVNGDIIDPYLVVREANKTMDKKIINDILFEKLEYKYNIKNQFHFVY